MKLPSGYQAAEFLQNLPSGYQHVARVAGSNCPSTSDSRSDRDSYSDPYQNPRGIARLLLPLPGSPSLADTLPIHHV
jgi:hypothetical protein